MADSEVSARCREFTSDVLVGLIGRALDRGAPGVLVSSVPGFDTDALVVRLAELHRRTGFYLCLLGQFSYLEKAALHVGFNQEDVTTSAERAVSWRATKALVVFATRDQGKTTSLREFTRVRSSDLLAPACELAREKARNVPQTSFWEALRDRDLHLPVQGVLECAAAAVAVGKIDDEYGAFLPVLGLMRDDSILGERTPRDIGDRLKANLALLHDVEQLTQRQLRAIRLAALKPDALAGDDARWRALNNYRKPTNKLSALEALDFDGISNLIDRSRRKRPKAAKPQRSQRDPVDSLVPLLADNRLKDLAILAQDVGESLYSDDEDAAESVVNPITHDRYDRISRYSKTWPFIEMASTNLAWGGVLRTETHSIQPALAAAAGSDFDPFLLNGPQSLRELLEQQVAMGTLPGSVLDHLTAAEGHRSRLIPKQRMLVESPVLFLAADDDLRQDAAGLVASMQELYSAVKTGFEGMAARGVQSAEAIVGQLLTLDQLIVAYGEGGFSLVALPLNTVEVWKHLALADQMRAQVKDLDADELELLQVELGRLPALLDVLTVPDFVTGRGVHTLAYVSKIGYLPYYEEVNRRFRETEGTDDVTHIAERLLNVYPHAREGLRVTFVDPPSPMAAVASLRGLVGTSANRAKYVHVTIFRPQLTRDAGAFLSEDEEDAFGDEIYSGSRRRMGVDYEDFPSTGGYGRVSEFLKRTPQHLVVIWDPSTLTDQRYPQSRGPDIHPLCVPMSLRYDEALDQLSLVPEPNGYLFSDRNDIESKLTHHSRGTFAALTARQQIAELAAVSEMAQHTLWVAIADYAKETSLPVAVPTLGFRRAGRREVALYSRHLDKFETAFGELLRHSNFDPQPERLHAALLEIVAFLDEGMLQLLARRTGAAVLQPRLIGAIGMLVVIDRLRQEHPNAVIVSMDSEMARRWLRVDGSDQRADVLALIDHDDWLELRVIEVKSHDAQHDDVEIRDGVASGPAVVQLERTAMICDEILTGEGADLLTAARREALRTQIFAALRGADKASRLQWSHRANDLLNRRSSGKVTATLASVQFYEPGPGSKREAKTPNGRDVTIDVLTQRDVRNYFDPRLPAQGVGRVDRAGTNLVSESPFETEEISGVEEEVSAYAVATRGDPSSQSSDRDRIPARPQEAVPTITDKDSVERQAADIQRVLLGYDLPVLGIDPALAQVGPSIIRYRIRLGSNARIRDLERRAPDIQREIAAVRLPLIGNVPGENFAYIDLRRPDPEVIYLRDALVGMTPPSAPDLLIPVGKSPAGFRRDLDLAEAPHLLVAGTTKSGKTMFLYSVIIALAKRNNADHVQLLLVDPKETDFVYFEGLPHLHETPVLTEASTAVEVIRAMVEPGGELETRTQQLKTARCRDIQDYNRRHPLAPLRPLVVVIDEYADLIIVLGRNKAEFETSINRLAQRGRSVGIHLVVATQRPSTDFVTGALKANMPSRISFRLPSQTDSRVILDQNGAESLLGQGDMLLLENSELDRLQGFFVSPEEIDALLA